MNHDIADDAQPVITRLADFDPRSGSLAERAFFNHRPLVLLLCLLATLLLGWQGLGLTLNASFEKTIPVRHPYIANLLAHRADVGGQGNALRIAVAVTEGDIFSAAYLETLRKLNDELFLLPGVDRPFMKSLWTSNTRWIAVTEEGLDGDTVIGDRYDGSPAALAEVRANVERSGEIGQLVAADFKSSIVFVPLLDKDPRTGAALDYGELARRIEALRSRYQTGAVRIHVTGFAKVVGDLIEGLHQMLGFFALALAITAAVLYGYTRCVRSTLLVVACSLVAIAWQFGLLKLLGYELDPYSVLVPFLVFAIGMSHGAQKMNGILQDVGRGTHRVVAARYTFRRLFVAGLTALLCDAVGFAVLALIPIRVIQELAAIASIGVAVLVFTNLVLLPVLLSYLGVSAAAATRSLRLEADETAGRGLRTALVRFTERGPARAAVAAAAVLAVAGYASLLVSLKDHKAETLARVVAEIEAFIAEQPADAKALARFMLGAGSAGIAAATNIVVAQAMREMLLWVYGAVLLLCWFTFRSWRAVLVAVLPLVLTSILCEALMVSLSMGVKVATLPVIALGVGIGVDYALYVLSVMLVHLRRGDTLAAAYDRALQFTGRVVMLTGLTLALAVGTWVLSPIKFQADMGVLLAFMFVWNMVGALVLLPALARWLLPARAPRTAPAAADAVDPVPTALSPANLEPQR